jgi:uncharacterized YkwD family protein
MVDLVNQARADNGLAPLKVNLDLARVARIKAQDMADNGYFDHNSPTYGSPFDMMTKFGISYRTAGENIAKGSTGVDSLQTAFMNSSGHRANILGSSYTQIGIGIYKTGGMYYISQMFIG